MNNKCGFIDIIGNKIIPCIYDTSTSFDKGMALVSLNRKYGFIDKTGKILIPFIYDDANNFTEEGGCFAWVRQNGKAYLINRKGEICKQFS